MFWFNEKLFSVFRGRAKEKKILILLLSESCLCYASDRSGDEENIPLRTLHQKWSQLFYVQIKIIGKKRFFTFRIASTAAGNDGKSKIIGTLFKVHQNQITSKFPNLNQNSTARDSFCDLEFLMFICVQVYTLKLRET